MIFGTVGSIALSKSRRPLSSRGVSSKCRHNQAFLSPVRGATSVFLCRTLALVTLAFGSACPQLVKNCPSIQLMIHEELTHHKCNESCISVVRSLGRRVSSDVHPERILHNIQRHAAIPFGDSAPDRSCFELVTLFDQLRRAEDR